MCVVVKYPRDNVTYPAATAVIVVHSTDLSLLCTTGDCYVLHGDLVAFLDDVSV